MKTVIHFAILFGTASGTEMKSSVLHELYKSEIHEIYKMQTGKYSSTASSSLTSSEWDETNIIWCLRVAT